MTDKKSKAIKKRERNPLTFYEKIAVIRHHETNHISQNNLARMFQCCTNQIRRILERKKEILLDWETMRKTDATAIIGEMTKKRREFEKKAIAFILYQWVERCRSLGLNMVINDNTLKNVAIKMSTVLNLPEFRPTTKWIDNFRLKFKYKDEDLSNVRCKDDPQGVLSVEDIIIEFKHFLPNFMQQEILNITSNSFAEHDINEEGSIIQNGKESIIQNDKESIALQQDVQNETKVSTEDINLSENNNLMTSNCCNTISTDVVLEYLSAIQQFSLGKKDFRAAGMAVELENHIRENYFPTEHISDIEVDVGDDIILIE